MAIAGLTAANMHDNGEYRVVMTKPSRGCWACWGGWYG